MEWITVRVYGLLIHKGNILVADQIIKGRRITKFPGGGLQYGEGLKEALVREIHEELGAEALALEHFHTTDVFQQSAFHKEPMQVISVYYTFSVPEPEKLPVIASPFDYTIEGCQEAFRWLPLEGSSPEAMSLPIDRTVFTMVLDGAVGAGRMG